MSWNLIILPPDDLDEDASLGDAAEVRASLESVLSPIEWDDPAHGTHFGHDFRIDIDLQPAGPVESFTLHVTGDGDPVRFVANACRTNGWAVFDSIIGDYLDTNNPSDLGWRGYHAHIAGKVVPPDEQ